MRWSQQAGDTSWDKAPPLLAEQLSWAVLPTEMSSRFCNGSPMAVIRNGLSIYHQWVWLPARQAEGTARGNKRTEKGFVRLLLPCVASINHWASAVTHFQSFQSSGLSRVHLDMKTGTPDQFLLELLLPFRNDPNLVLKQLW